MKSIRIVRRPSGEAPEWVRDAWIGLSLPTPQKSARAFGGSSISDGQVSVLLRFPNMFRGKAGLVSGFAVNGRTAVDLLAESQPAAAEWWRANAAPLLTGKHYLVFDADCCEDLGGTSSASELLWGSKRFRDTYPASPGRIAVLWMMATVVRIVGVTLGPGAEMRAVSSTLYLSGTSIFAAFLAAWALRLRGSTLHLISMFVSVDLLLACLYLMMEFITSDPVFAYWIVVGLYFLMIASLIGTGFARLRSRKRRAAAVLLAMGATMGAGSLQTMDGAFWYLSASARPMLGLSNPFDQEENDPPQIDADILWGAQSRLVQTELSTLRPSAPAMMNVYAMAVAASGSQAIFSREAHEALRAAAAHFGEKSRGGVLLSNGTVDLMQAPLATRDNIAAVAHGIGAKADHRHDLLFLYLTSHGGRTAELLSELSDYQSIQPISSTSTEDALRKSGISRRIIVVSACFAASWIPALADDDSIVITAAAKDRTSFGCDDRRRLTLFGESFLGSLATKGISLHDAFEDAKRKISVAETKEKATPSFPQVFVGKNMEALWLGRQPDTSAR